MKDFHDFLTRHSGDGATESGVFTLDPKRAREQTLEYLRQSSSKFPVHFLAAAYYHGAREVRASSNPKKSKQFSRLRGKEAPHFSLYFDTSLTSEQLEALPGALLEHSQPGLQRLSWTLHQLLTFQPSWVRVTSLNQGKGFTLTLSPSKLHPVAQPHSERDPELKGLLIECSRLVTSGLVKIRRPHFPPLTALAKELETVASRSSLRCFLDERRLDLEGPPSEALHFLPRQEIAGGEMEAWLERPPALSEAVVVGHGITLSPLSLSCKTHGNSWFPGLKLVLYPKSPVWDASKLQIVLDHEFDEFLKNALERAASMLGELANSETAECRHYLLSNWWRFPHLPLDTYSLFRTLTGHFTSLQDLLTRHRSPDTLGGELEPEDAAYARALYTFEHDYRFSRGGPRAAEHSLCPRGRWLALSGPEAAAPGLGLSFHSLSRPRQSHSPRVTLKEWKLSWHPTEPWIALPTHDGVLVWDLKLERELAFFSGDFCSMGFSQYGRYLNLYEQESPRRVAYWKVTLPDFQRADEPFELPGFNPLAVGNLLLLWQTDRRFQVRHFSDLSTLVEEFTTDCPATRLVDISPCYRFALLGSPVASYLYDIVHQTLRKLLSQIQLGRFSWNSDVLFSGEADRQSVIHTHSLVAFPVEPPAVHLFRSGVALQTSPGGSLFPNLLLKNYQHCPLQDHRPAFVYREEGDFERLSVVDEHGRKEEIWRFGVSQAGALRAASGQVYLGVSCPDGTRLHNLHNGAVTIARQCTPTKGRLLKREDGTSRFVDPETQEPFLAVVHGREIRLVHEFLPDEFLVESDGLFLNIHSKGVGGGNLLQRAVDQVAYLHLGGQLTQAIIRDGFLACGSGPGTAHWPPAFNIPATRLACCPERKKLAVLSETAVTVLDFELCRIAARLPDDMGGERLFWLSEQHLYLNGIVWRPHPVEGWNTPLTTPAPISADVVSLPGTHLAIESGGPEHRLLSLTHGHTLAIYRTLADHWFLFTPQGDWDGSDGCLDFVRPRPLQTPTPHLLKRIVEAAAATVQEP